MSDLTPTSFAMLSLLSIRPWSAYDLTRYMTRSTLRAIWPRAESRIYAEVRRLEAHGAATSKVERTGGRKRSVYSITDAGREALNAWLHEPSKRFVYESEAMLKVAYSDNSDLDELRRTLAEMHAEATQDLAIMRDVFRAIVGGARSVPGRVGHNALVSMFALELIEARLRWIAFAEGFVEQWNDTRAGDAKEAQGVACYTAMVDRIDALLAGEPSEND
jgi:DNA-binding PadR family transcriptional regulator